MTMRRLIAIAGLFVVLTGVSIAAFLLASQPLSPLPDPPAAAGDYASIEDYEARLAAFDDYFGHSSWGAEVGYEDVLAFYLLSGESLVDAEYFAGMATSAHCMDCPEEGLTAAFVRDAYFDALSGLERDVLDALMTVEIDLEMFVGQTYDATVAFQLPNAEGEAPQLEALAEQLPAPTAMTDSISVNGELRVHLIGGADFAVAETKGGWQSVVPASPSLWTWTLSPRESGTRTLLLAIETRTSAGGTDVIVPVASYPRTIEVRVHEMQWAGELWDWTTANVAGVLTALAAGITAAVGVTQLHQYAVSRKPRTAAAPKARRRSK